MVTKSYQISATEIPFNHEKKQQVHSTYFAIINYYKKYPNPGACHLISSIFYILLNEQDIENDLCIGEVKIGVQYFDHSWNEINGEIFDIAIQSGLDGSTNSPIYSGYKLTDLTKPEHIYGSKSPVGLDDEAKQVFACPFVRYIDAYPHFKQGAWKIVKDIGKELRLKLDIPELREKYKETKRLLKS